MRHPVIIKRILLLALTAACMKFTTADGQDKVSNCRWKRDDMFHGYVLCNGKKVDAAYMVVNSVFVTLGVNSYVEAAIDTTIAGRVEVPWLMPAPDGHVFRVMGVGRHCFGDCRRLTEVVLPDSMKDIGDQAFLNCRSLRSIVLPPGLRYIWPYAFRGCSRLNRIEAKSSMPPDSYNDVFDERTMRFATLVVPAASADQYRNSFVWNMFRYFAPNWD